MKILLIHSDFIEYEAKEKAMKTAEEIDRKTWRVDNALVVFTSVEKGDTEELVKKTAHEIMDVARQVKPESVVIYPFVHLSKSPAPPNEALALLKKIESSVTGYKVFRAPFGWYKSFNIKCKGHPLSELSREITIGTPSKEEKKDIHEKKTIRDISAKTSVQREALAENDHRILGQDLDLYSFQEVAPGMVFFHPKGMRIRNKLTDFWRREHTKAGYHEIQTPMIMNKGLWEVSGHWDHYKDNMFFTKIDENDFAMKPMNCPGAIMVFRHSTRSYKDLPLRLAELGYVHRNELSGVLSGLFRLREFTQDDAHIFVTPQQLEDEIMRVVKLVSHFYKIFGFEYHVELSTRPEKRMGDEKLWDAAEKALEDVLKKEKMNYKLNAGDGAFYGPKIDFHIKDSLGRTWQCATVQVDFQMPERFDIHYVGEDGKNHRPVIVHRVIYGAIERFIGILVEHYRGAFPLWLAPVQARVLSFTDRNNDAVNKTAEWLQEHGIRAEVDARASTVEYKVRDAEMQKIHYIIVIGDKEEQNNTLAVRTRGDKKPAFGVDKNEFLAKILKEIDEKK